MAAVFRPGGVFQNMDDGLAAHAGDGDRVHLVGMNGGKAVTQTQLQAGDVVLPRCAAGVLQGLSADVGGDGAGDAALLEQRLGVPVVPAAARSGEGLPELMYAVERVIRGECAARVCRVRYAQPLEAALALLTPAVANAVGTGGPAPRWLALRLLEGDTELNAGIVRYLGFSLAQHPDVAEILARARRLLAEGGVTQQALHDEVVRSLVRTAETVCIGAVRHTPTPQELCAPVYAEVADLDETTRMQYVDLWFWLVGDILLKTDKMSMAHSLESRVPFLDKKVFELSATIPTSQKVSEEKTKLTLRQASERAIPRDWAQKEKLGFPTPVVAWLREDKYYTQVKRAFTSTEAMEFFDVKELLALLDQHKSGAKDNSRKIWIIYMFLMWYRIYFIDCAVPEKPVAR